MHPQDICKATLRDPTLPMAPLGARPLLLGDPFCSSPVLCQGQPHPPAPRPSCTHNSLQREKTHPTKQQPALPFQRQHSRCCVFLQVTLLIYKSSAVGVVPRCSQQLLGTAAGCCRRQAPAAWEHRHRSVTQTWNANKVRLQQLQTNNIHGAHPLSHISASDMVEGDTRTWLLPLWWKQVTVFPPSQTGKPRSFQYEDERTSRKMDLYPTPLRCQDAPNHCDDAPHHHLGPSSTKPLHLLSSEEL